MSRLSIDLTPDQHNAIKAMALLEGVNIKKYVMKRIFGDVKGECLSFKEPNAQLQAAIDEVLIMEKEINTGKIERHKTSSEIFDRYR